MAVKSTIFLNHEGVKGTKEEKEIQKRQDQKKWTFLILEVYFFGHW